jgi:hypothetical protein
MCRLRLSSILRRGLSEGMPDRARGVQRVIRYCDGWLPNAGLSMDLPKQTVELHHLAEQAGRCSTSTIFADERQLFLPVVARLTGPFVG